MTLQEFIHNTSIDPKYHVGLCIEIPDTKPYVKKFEIISLSLGDIYDEHFKPTSIIDHIYFYDNYSILIDLVNEGEK